jgi:tRNA modification GTPase
MLHTKETICAPATSGGGAISVIRVSGRKSIEICGKIFFAADKNIRFGKLPGYSVVHGEIRSADEVVDDVLVTIFRKPHSYTGEDSVEISCHASPYIRRTILELLISNGAVPSMPGEFTRRAFLNGKMDLLQAEAVADIIASSARASHRVAMNQMRGGFSSEIGKLRSDLLHIASLIELELDFGEEDVKFADRNELRALAFKIKSRSDELAASFRTGNTIRNGIPVVIVGKPNSGKSTLLNALLKEEKAIVSEIPGTTRDVIEDTLILDGIEYRFIDTAGLRETTDVIENLGIKKTHEKIAGAEVILMVDEVSDSPEFINIRAQAIRDMVRASGKRLMILINKADMAGMETVHQLTKEIVLQDKDELLFISAKEETGLDNLRQKLGEVVEKERLNSDNVIVTNIRHYDALSRVSESLGRVLKGLAKNIPDDLVATDIRQAIHYLGEITGEITSDEILGNIFKNFCIGK